MSEELQKEIDRLKAANDKLTKDLSGLAEELKETRAEARDRRHEAKKLTEQLGELVTDRDKWKGQAETDPENLRKQLGEKDGTIRAMKHERAYEKVAKAHKVTDPTKLADLVKLAEYAPEGDEPDEPKIAARFQEVLKGRSWLVDSTESRDSTTAPGGANGAKDALAGGKPGPGADRGQSSSVTSQGVRRDGKPVGAL